MKVEVYGYKLVRVHHEELVIEGTRWRRLSGRLNFKWLGSHKSSLRERISKHSRLARRSIGRDGRGDLLSSQCCLSLLHLPHLW